jgi:hypothetical protein
MSENLSFKRKSFYLFVILIILIILSNYKIYTYSDLIDYKNNIVNNDNNNIPVYFEEVIVGDNKKIYRASGLSYNIMLRKNDALLLYMNKEDESDNNNLRKRGITGSSIFSPVYLRFINANKSAIVVGSDKIVKKLNYYNDKNEVSKTINLYKEIKYKDIYPGVDLVFSVNKNNFNYSFYINDDSKVKNILLEIDGVKNLVLNAENNIEFNISGEQIIQEAPRVFIVKNNKKIEKTCSFYIKDKNLIELNIK